MRMLLRGRGRGRKRIRFGNVVGLRRWWEEHVCIALVGCFFWLRKVFECMYIGVAAFNEIFSSPSLPLSHFPLHPPPPPPPLPTPSNRKTKKIKKIKKFNEN